MESQSLPNEGMWKPPNSPLALSDSSLSYPQKPVKSQSYHGSIVDEMTSPRSPVNAINGKPFATRSASFLTTDVKFSNEENGKKLLQSGTLAKIVEWVVFEQIEVNTILNLIHTFKLHTTASGMLDLLFMVYKAKLSESSSPELKDRMAAMLKVWFLNSFEVDFKKRGLWKKLLDFVCAELPNDYSNSFKLMLLSKMSAKERPVAQRSKKAMKVSPKVEDIFQHAPEFVANQMTIIARKLLRAIRPSEFYNNAWQKKNKDKTSPNLTKYHIFLSHSSFCP